MNFDPPSRSASPSDANDTPVSAIIVEPALADALVAVAVLTSLSFHVTVTNDFLEAKALIHSRRPSLVVTEMQLGDYNGLHLLVLARAAREDAAVIITTRRFDRSLRAEAMSMGATVVPTPTSQTEMRAAVLRTLLRAPGDAVPELEPFERRHHERRVREGERTGPERRRGERRRKLEDITRTLRATRTH